MQLEADWRRENVMSRNNLLIASLFTVVLGLTACGSSTGDRALTGGAIGAAGGAAVGAVTGGSAVTGAVVGGAAGAATGALTDEDDIDLGDTIYD
jgi:hypothetical protein